RHPEGEHLLGQVGRDRRELGRRVRRHVPLGLQRGARLLLLRRAAAPGRPRRGRETHEEAAPVDQRPTRSRPLARAHASCASPARSAAARLGDPTCRAVPPRPASGRRRLGVAPVSGGEGPSDRSRHQAAAAIIAALSVHIARLGTKGRMPSSSHASTQRDRSALLAATPPPRTRPLAPTSRAARRALVTSTSTTASWKLAATSAVDTSGWRRTWLTTAVFRPLKLNA